MAVGFNNACLFRTNLVAFVQQFKRGEDIKIMDGDIVIWIKNGCKCGGYRPITKKEIENLAQELDLNFEDIIEILRGTQEKEKDI